MRAAPLLVMTLMASGLLLPLFPTAATTTAAAATPATAGDADAAARGLAFLAAQQRPDGSFPFVQPPYVVEAAAAAGLDPRAWPTPERSAFAGLRPYAGYSDLYAHLRNAYAAAVSGYTPRDVNGQDLVAFIRAGFGNGQFGDVAYVNDDAWAILALRASGVPADDEQIQAAALFVELARAQDGGWNHQSRPVTGDTDVTGMTLAALKAAGRDLSGDVRAKLFLDGNKDAATGAYRGMAAGGHNCQSTAWAIHAHRALGLEPDPKSLAYLRGLQQPDGGFATSPPNGGGTARSHPWCTAEAIVVLNGLRHPLPGYVEARVDAPPLHAREPATLRLAGGPFTTVTWRFPDGDATGATLTRAFATSGAVPYSVDADGPHGRHRHHATLHVADARPRIEARLAPTTTHVHETIHLDAIRSMDPDGRVVRLVVDWGDGNATASGTLRARHAYAHPGTYQVRAHVEDDAGHASDPFQGIVQVHNRAPRFPPLPERLVGDRLHPINLPWNATDPDGDPLTLHWRAGDNAGTEPRADFTALGNHNVTLHAHDPHGATAQANVTVEIVNLPPALTDLRLPTSPRADEPITLTINATDPDGPTPNVTWTLGTHTHTGPNVTTHLPTGAYPVRIVATDADGAQRRLDATLLVGAPESVLLPEVRDVTATLTEGILRVAFAPQPPPGARVVVAWRSDAGEGETEANASTLDVPLPGATEARVRVTVHLGPLSASAEAGPVRAAPPPQTTPAPAPQTTREPEETAEPASESLPAPVEVAAAPAAEPVGAEGRAETPVSPSPSEPRDAKAPQAETAQAPRKETPAPTLPWLAPLLVAPLLRRRGTRAP